MTIEQQATIDFLRSHGFSKASAKPSYMNRLYKRLALHGVQLDGKYETIGGVQVYRPYFKPLQSASKTVIIKVR